MGSEIIFPIAIGLSAILLFVVSSGIIYAVLFQFRNVSRLYRAALRAILNAIGLLLFAISALSVFPIVIWVMGALFGDMEPFSDRFVLIGAAVFLAGILAAAWWGLFSLSKHLDKSLRPQLTMAALEAAIQGNKQ